MLRALDTDQPRCMHLDVALRNTNVSTACRKQDLLFGCGFNVVRGGDQGKVCINAAQKCLLNIAEAATI